LTGPNQLSRAVAHIDEREDRVANHDTCQAPIRLRLGDRRRSRLGLFFRRELRHRESAGFTQNSLRILTRFELALVRL
jgi:hypothetical protein